MNMHQRTSLGWAERQAQKDVMKTYERAGEIIGLVIVGLVALFFYANQIRATGFFTAAFGPLEAFLLYGSILIGMLPLIVRMGTGHRNVARPAEIVSSLFCIVSAAWLLAVFPFNFAHFADLMPSFMQYLLSWLTNDIARIFLALGVFGGAVSIIINAWLFVRVGAILSSPNL